MAANRCDCRVRILNLRRGKMDGVGNSGRPSVGLGGIYNDLGRHQGSARPARASVGSGSRDAVRTIVIWNGFVEWNSGEEIVHFVVSAQVV